ncbi:dihydrodipicolinate synthase family protein [Stella sp.]|uniref:dihydrodipicolinate synthase family protein n=1 Tax=Stella sp. TaxID=2912054 RepID=UPI0035B4956C
MPKRWQDIDPATLALLREGTVIPAHPLALGPDRRLDRRHQRALSRYYLASGSGGMAVGVHSTQFAIRETGLYEPVLRLAAETAAGAGRPIVLVGGIVGRTEQALREAAIVRDLGYHAGLLGLGAWRGTGEAEVLDHCRRIAAEIPIMGFYLQPAAGGLLLSADFWRRFAEIENVVAIKMAPFNRYRTLDVIRGVVMAGAEDRITLYTGNDDHIVLDLLTPFGVRRGGETVTVRIRGGLLGHWSVWTRRAVEQLARIKAAVAAGPIPADLLALDSMVTDANSAFFDVANDFRGCIPGCHEVLRRQGLMQGIWCLDPDETLSPGQAAEIDRVVAAYPELGDDDFVAANRDAWLAD